MFENIKPVVARVKIPALVRGKELITETGLFGNQTKYAKSLIKGEEVLSAGFFIGNPFTDVPELCSQSYVYTNNNKDLASKIKFAAKNKRLMKKKIEFCYKNLNRFDYKKSLNEYYILTKNMINFN